MSDDTAYVVSKDDVRGTFAEAAHLANNGEPTRRVDFENGVSVHVPTDALLQREDGNFGVIFTVDELVERAKNPPESASEPLGGEAIIAPPPSSPVSQAPNPPPGTDNGPGLI